MVRYFISLLFLSLFASTAIYAKPIHAISVPFTQITISTGEKIQGDYHFGAHQTIVCRDINNSKSASIEWKYKGVTYKKMLPVILKDDKRYQGEWADSGDYFLLTNEFSSYDIHVSCEYKNMD